MAPPVSCTIQKLQVMASSLGATIRTSRQGVASWAILKLSLTPSISLTFPDQASSSHCITTSATATATKTTSSGPCNVPVTDTNTTTIDTTTLRYDDSLTSYSWWRPRNGPAKGVGKTLDQSNDKAPAQRCQPAGIQSNRRHGVLLVKRNKCSAHFDRTTDRQDLISSEISTNESTTSCHQVENHHQSQTRRKESQTNSIDLYAPQLVVDKRRSNPSQVISNISRDSESTPNTIIHASYGLRQHKSHWFLSFFHLYFLISCIKAYPLELVRSNGSTSFHTSTHRTLHTDWIPGDIDKLSEPTVTTNRHQANQLPHHLQRTPNYMFSMHQRHKQDWLDFNQFSQGHLPQPLPFPTIQSVKKRRRRRNHHRRLGVVTAIRHHQFLDSRNGLPEHTYSPSKPFHSYRDHQLLFRLADMPSHEKLLAASIRLRYSPEQNSSETKKEKSPIHCSENNGEHHWPITLWLHSETNRGSSIPDIKTRGSFEPDLGHCHQSSSGSNHTLLHFSEGWFNIPLNTKVLRMLNQIQQARFIGEERHIAVTVRSMTSPWHGDTERIFKQLKLNGTHSNWLHEAPHLLTFHRDPVLVKHVKRMKRSVTASSRFSAPIDVATTREAAPKSSPERTTKNPPNGSFVQRYQKLQQILKSSQPKPLYKRRLPRRVKHQRLRRSPASWDQPSSSQSQQMNKKDHRSNYEYYYNNNARRDDSNTYNNNHHQQQQQSFRSNDDNAYNAYPNQRANSNINDPASNLPGQNYLDNLCQRRDLIIDFAAVGWASWVIAPRAYNARYCYGQCPFPLSTHYNTTNHAVLLQLVHLLDAARVAGPCCVPHELSAQSLLYHDRKGDVVLRVYQDMVVESCACK